jgi:hypothetical protein
MKDEMLTVLYEKLFQEKRSIENTNKLDETTDRTRQVALAKHALLSELVDIRTEQIKNK